jgi:hypothetical protein
MVFEPFELDVVPVVPLAFGVLIPVPPWPAAPPLLFPPPPEVPPPCAKVAPVNAKRIAKPNMAFRPVFMALSLE